MNDAPSRPGSVLAVLAVCGAVGLDCGTEAKKGAPQKPRTTLERRLEPAPSADIKKAVEAVEADEDPAKRPWVFRWPLRNIDVTSPYGLRMHPVVRRLLFHSGVDFRAPRGEPVLAAGPGHVTKAGWMPLTGMTVILHHPGELATLYAHLDELLVYEGQPVSSGAPVGLIGSTGRSTGPHLHFSVYALRGKDRHPLDPTEFVGTVIHPERPPRPPLPPIPRPPPGGPHGGAPKPHPYR